MPFFRSHSHRDYTGREFWVQTPRVQLAIKQALNMRYTFIHYIYTRFEHSTHTGDPLMRPMWYEFLEQPDLWEIYSQFMFGESVLFAPKVNKPIGDEIALQVQKVNYTLPINNNWYSFITKL